MEQVRDQTSFRKMSMVIIILLNRLSLISSRFILLVSLQTFFFFFFYTENLRWNCISPDFLKATQCRSVSENCRCRKLFIITVCFKQCNIMWRSKKRFYSTAIQLSNKSNILLNDPSIGLVCSW